MTFAEWVSEWFGDCPRFPANVDDKCDGRQHLLIWLQIECPRGNLPLHLRLRCCIPDDKLRQRPELRDLGRSSLGGTGRDRFSCFQMKRHEKSVCCKFHHQFLSRPVPLIAPLNTWHSRTRGHLFLCAMGALTDSHNVSISPISFPSFHVASEHRCLIFILGRVEKF